MNEPIHFYNYIKIINYSNQSKKTANIIFRELAKIKTKIAV